MKICKKISNLIMIVAFFLVLVFPPVYFEKVKDTIPQDTSENRKLAEKPEFNFEKIDSYASDYEAYYNDNLPFRSFIRNTWTNFNFFVFGESTTNQVLVGKNDGDLSSSWLFYQENYDGNPIKETQGVYKFTEDEVLNIGKTINTNFSTISSYFNQIGIDVIKGITIGDNRDDIIESTVSFMDSNVDVMRWINTQNKSYCDFMKEITQHSCYSPYTFFTSFIDQYYVLNYFISKQSPFVEYVSFSANLLPPLSSQ